MPIVEVLLISTLGALMATDRFNLLHNDARKSLNKVSSSSSFCNRTMYVYFRLLICLFTLVPDRFTLFTPALMFASLTKTVTLDEIISWWFMPINIA
ncbi:unnamed protein product [Rhodiola kirilowii]